MIVVCKYCRKVFQTYPCKINNGRGKFCSKLCYKTSTRKPLICNFCKNIFSDKSQCLIKFCSKECKMNGSFGDSIRKQTEYRKTHTSPCLGKKYPKRCGKNSSRWKGGITPKNLSIRNSVEYKLWRKSVFERDNYTCIWCGLTGLHLNADHIKPFAYYPELRFAIDNGRTLCVNCHRKTDTYGGRIKFVQGK